MDRYAVMQPPPPPSPPRNPGHEHQKHQQQISARPGKKRGRKPGIHSSAVQRNAANARERSRMRVLSTAFAKLKSVLPWVPRDTKLSKLDTLKLASGYIAHLRRKLDYFDTQDTSTPVSPSPTNIGSISRTPIKGSAPSLTIKHEERPTLQTSESENSQAEYGNIDGQAVEAYSTWWTWCDGSMGCLNNPTCTPFLPHPVSETAATTTNDLVVPSSPSASSSASQHCILSSTTSQPIDNNLPTVVFQRQFFR
ncbi:Transcription factor 21 [Taenia crassiceps]|uniref:Transcription factor 21 n=1 Tax=Taenia crassiceps TaxID=6207 RepID=A0ABR4Q8U3_9CEST